MSEIVNPALGRIEGLFKDLVWDNLINSAIAAVYIQVPWLGSWFFRGLTAGVIRLVGDKLFEGMRLFVDLQAISIINEQHRKTFERAVVTLKVIERDKGPDSEEFKNAREAAKIHFAQFVRFGATR